MGAIQTRRRSPYETDHRNDCGNHLQSIEDLYEMPDRPEYPYTGRSGVAKFLDKPLWEELKDKTDASGWTFKKAIFSGCKNTDSRYGIYAGSDDSYIAFKSLYDQIIQKFHKHKPETLHPTNLYISPALKLDCPPITDALEVSKIKSIKITTQRNFASYPLSPMLSASQRNEIMSSIQSACDQFDDRDLMGTFVPYATNPNLTLGRPDYRIMPKHVSFPKGDRYKEHADINADWPEGRAVFFNDRKDLYIWVNEEDQFKIHCTETEQAMQANQCADLLATFDRLLRATTQIQEKTGQEYLHNAHLGYITTCPGNLGTGLKISVRVKACRVFYDYRIYNELKKPLKCQITEIRNVDQDSEVELSNKFSLGHSEVDLIQQVYDGVKAFVKKEIELEAIGLEPIKDSLRYG